MLGPWARLSLVPTIVPGARRGARPARGRCAGGRCRLRRRGGADRARRGLSAVELPRLRALEPGRGARARAGRGGGADNVEIRHRRAEEAAQHRRVRAGAHVRLPARHDAARRGCGRDPSRDRRRRHLAGQGDPLRRHLGREPPQPDAGDVPRVLGHLVHVLRAVGAGRRRTRDGRSAAARLRATGERRRLHTLPVHDFEDPANLYYEVRP